MASVRPIATMYDRLDSTSSEAFGRLSKCRAVYKKYASIAYGARGLCLLEMHCSEKYRNLCATNPTSDLVSKILGSLGDK